MQKASFNQVDQTGDVVQIKTRDLKRNGHVRYEGQKFLGGADRLRTACCANDLDLWLF